MTELRRTPSTRSTPSVARPISTVMSFSGPSPATARRRAGVSGMFRSSATRPPSSSSSRRSMSRTRVALSKPASRTKVPSAPSSRSIRRSTVPDPPASCAEPATDSVAGMPMIGSPSSTSAIAISPIFTLTGRSGRAKGVASGAGRSGPSGGNGGLTTVNRSAVSASISSDPESRASRRQLSRASSRTSHSPSASEMLSRSSSASDDRAPRKPSMRTCRFSPSTVAIRSAGSGGRGRPPPPARAADGRARWRKGWQGQDRASECLPDADIEKDIFADATAAHGSCKVQADRAERGVVAQTYARACMPVAVLEPRIGTHVSGVGKEHEAEIAVAQRLAHLGRQCAEAAPARGHASLQRAERLVILSAHGARAARVEQVVGRDQVDIAAEKHTELPAGGKNSAVLCAKPEIAAGIRGQARARAVVQRDEGRRRPDHVDATGRVERVVAIVPGQFAGKEEQGGVPRATRVLEAGGPQTDAERALKLGREPVLDPRFHADTREPIRWLVQTDDIDLGIGERVGGERRWPRDARAKDHIDPVHFVDRQFSLADATNLAFEAQAFRPAKEVPVQPECADPRA